MKVKIGPHIWTVTRDAVKAAKTKAEESSTGTYGVMDTTTLSVNVDPACERSMQDEVLLHEILHACFASSGDIFSTVADARMEADDLEECIVANLAPVLLGVLQDNPQLVQRIAKETK